MPLLPLYHGKVFVGDKLTRKISFRAGVKQGDPLSPALFNAVLDGLITELNEKQPRGTLSSSCKIAALAFADDLLLLLAGVTMTLLRRSCSTP
ncbi:Reverse transcriptase (RNA-dependent DNA polymerase) [Popillia japonica]|uniref:Reverse transcriptase (RNA-dependent DNA polymerase) n=1 Tax=Popillia japonica TaxID=7064 RepID=A0AAW1MM56_POPJA